MAKKNEIFSEDEIQALRCAIVMIAWGTKRQIKPRRITSFFREKLGFSCTDFCAESLSELLSQVTMPTLEECKKGYSDAVSWNNMSAIEIKARKYVMGLNKEEKNALRNALKQSSNDND